MLEKLLLLFERDKRLLMSSEYFNFLTVNSAITSHSLHLFIFNNNSNNNPCGYKTNEKVKEDKFEKSESHFDRSFVEMRC